MKKICVTLAAAAGCTLASVHPAHGATCTPTGFVRDGINMTAALINPAAPTSPLDATGCNIGIYIDHTMPGGVATIQSLDIYGANYFGVLVNGDAGPVQANIRNNFVHNIGENPFNGAQHGVGIYIRAFFPANVVTGEITGNTVFAYQKGGIVVNGPGGRISKVNNNRVTGQGHVTYIAQNGIQVGYGAMPYPSQLVGNVITGNSYIGTPGDGSAAAGLLVVGGPWLGTCPDGNVCPYTRLVAMGGNVLINNDTGVNVYNAEADFSAPPTPTQVIVLQNLAGSDFCYNQSYQAGISMFGNTDYIYSNYVVQGGGYGPAACGLAIDVTGSTNVQSGGNNVPVTGMTALAAVPSADAPRTKAEPIK
jgi:hypothetical protein